MGRSRGGSYGSRGGASKKWAGRTVWKGREEVPGRVDVFAEGVIEWYGSGRAVVTWWCMPIVMRLAWSSVGGRIRWATSASTRGQAVAILRKVLDVVTMQDGGQMGQADRGEYPSILEHLTLSKYPDGTSRETSSLVVVADATSWRVCLSDRDNGRVMWKTGPTLADAMAAIEMGLLADDPGDWRKSYGGGKPQRKRA